jgi:hypothetical protein
MYPLAVSPRAIMHGLSLVQSPPERCVPSNKKYSLLISSAKLEANQQPYPKVMITMGRQSRDWHPEHEPVGNVI